jgi:hypothetical protein
MTINRNYLYAAIFYLVKFKAFTMNLCGWKSICTFKIEVWIINNAYLVFFTTICGTKLEDKGQKLVRKRENERFFHVNGPADGFELACDNRDQHSGEKFILNFCRSMTE